MKKIGLLVFCFSVLISCKNNNKQENETAYQNDDLTLLKGQFVYYDGAAVLQTTNQIYGVFITEKLKALDKEAQKFKNQKTDMVTVEIRGKVTTAKDEKILWEQKVEVIDIINVAPQQTKDEQNVIKLGN